MLTKLFSTLFICQKLQFEKLNKEKFIMSMSLASFETKKTVKSGILAKIAAVVGDGKEMKGEEAKASAKGPKRLIDITALQAGLTTHTLTSLDLQNAWVRKEAKPTLAATLEGHRGTVSGLKVLADGTVVSGSYDETIKHWDLLTRQCLATLTEHKNYVLALAALADGTVVSGLAHNTLKHWDLRTGRCRATLSGHTNGVLALAVLADGTVVSGSADKTLKHWDLRTGRCLATLSGHKAWVMSLAVLADGTVVSGSGDKTLKHWNLRTGRCLTTLSGHTDAVCALAVLADGTVVSGGQWIKPSSAGIYAPDGV